MNLREKDRVRIIALAEKSFKSPFEIWAYGSRVNGDNHDGEVYRFIRTLFLKRIFSYYYYYYHLLNCGKRDNAILY